MTTSLTSCVLVCRFYSMQGSQVNSVFFFVFLFFFLNTDAHSGSTIITLWAVITVVKSPKPVSVSR